ncbi:hypothetical protein [Micromonospora globbae]|uniref:hypothetical protein n=1 Tax=Micromonospora globbae TaxID=1894969 RepID=UPI00386824C1|nr:hypothetical protein OH732_14360 [Micromonospora globbae]
MEKRYAVVVLSLAALLTACGGSASPDEQMAYLRSMARQGAELHAVDKGRGSAGEQEECAASYEHIYGGPQGHDMPHVENLDEKARLLKEGERLFIESCVNGTPSPVTGWRGPAGPPTPSAAPPAGHQAGRTAS